MDHQLNNKFILVESTDAIATITLNRSEKRNALHGPMIEELTHALALLAKDNSRLLLLKGAGQHFCAGGDIAWMQTVATCSDHENEHDAQALADLLYALYHFPKPTLALVHGAALGGGMGLVAAADIAIASKTTKFGLPEVKIGITPSIVSPYLLGILGERYAKYYFLTGEIFSADIANRLGLIHQVTEDEELMNAGLMLAKRILCNNLPAMREAKQLIHDVVNQPITELLSKKTAQHLAQIRKSPEGQKGLRAFYEK